MQPALAHLPLDSCGQSALIDIPRKGIFFLPGLPHNSLEQVPGASANRVRRVEEGGVPLPPQPDLSANKTRRD